MKISIEEQIKEIVNEYKKELSKDLEVALTNASELLKFELEYIRKSILLI